ncbi:protein disulfide isomerase-like 1-6 [Jatropha curcas]|uniref:protein disulfide isomerase-like 1-6 n=1 Tax=Jatropha curcas TaxID=180498 RepID=UPI001893CA7F|nr:protein disulfide isomerase-like 1-6 [Jatropha curcas]
MPINLQSISHSIPQTFSRKPRKKPIKITMFSRNPTSKFIFLSLTVLLLLTSKISVSASDESEIDTENDDELKELIAIDEQGEEEDQQQQQVQQKEAEVLSKAQRIVVELNSDNAKMVINDNEFVMILGYAPWCPRSAELMPQFAEAANKLKELGSTLLMSKLDAERYPKAASMLGIKGFPTLLLFVNGSSQAYTGGFSAEDLVIWTRKKTGVPIMRISSVTEAEGFLKKYHTFVLCLLEKFEGHDYEEFVKAATIDNELQFVEVSDPLVAKVLFPDIKSSNFFGIVKSEPEKYTAYEGTFEMEKLLQFVEHNKFPLVTRLTELNSVRVYSSPIKLQAMIFAEADNFRNLIGPLQEVARKFKSEIMFIYIDVADENLAKPFLTLFGLEDVKNTVVTAFDNRINSRYLLESDPTPSNIEEFCSALLHGSQSPYFKSQPIPDNNATGVQIIVGKTFDDLVLSSPKNVLLEVYTPWCINCETTSKQVEKLAKHFKGLENLVIGKIDASANEHPKLQVDDYPTLLFYPEGINADLAAVINKHLRAKKQASKDEL